MKQIYLAIPEKMVLILFLVFLNLSITEGQSLAGNDVYGRHSGYTSRCLSCEGGMYSIEKHKNEGSVSVDLTNYCKDNRIFILKFRDSFHQTWSTQVEVSIGAGKNQTITAELTDVDAVMVQSKDISCTEDAPRENGIIFLWEKIPAANTPIPEGMK